MIKDRSVHPFPSQYPSIHRLLTKGPLKMAPQSSNQEIIGDELRQKFCDILKSNGVTEEVDDIVMTEPPELKGEHFACVTVYVKVTFKDKGRKEKNLFVKKFSTSEAYAMWTKKMRIMEKESYFFVSLLPKMRDFCKKYTDGDFLNFFPKCLYADDEMVVLENMVLDDTWIMLDKEEKQDLYTAKFVLSNLARFHAASYAYIQEECGGSTKFQEDCEVACFEAFLNEAVPDTAFMFDNGVSTCVKLLDQFPVPGGTEAKETLGAYTGKIFPHLTQLVKPNPADKLQVLNHGDCWNNNMLFKRDSKTGKVRDHVFVDFQITRLCSPNLDVGYFLFTSLKPEIRRTHLKEVLLHYFNTFTETLKLFKQECPITFQEFYEDFKVKGRMGFFMNLVVLSSLAAMKDLNMEDMTENLEDMAEMFNKVIANWVEKNQEKAKDISTELVALLQEDEQLRTSQVE